MLDVKILFILSRFVPVTVRVVHKKRPSVLTEGQYVSCDAKGAFREFAGSKNGYNPGAIFKSEPSLGAFSLSFFGPTTVM